MQLSSLREGVFLQADISSAARALEQGAEERLQSPVSDGGLV